MLRFAIISKDNTKSIKLKDKICQVLTQQGAIEDPSNPSIVITVGGDGTMLRAIHEYMDHLDTISFIGIHSGTLGFFTNYTADQVEELCDDILHVEPSIHEYNLLKIDLEDEVYYAVNELRIENVYHTQSIDMYINDEFLQSFRGNGVCLSTSAGSTGYNRSLNGPIIESSLNLMVMTEIAGIHHRKYKSLQSPLVMGGDTVFKMVLTKSDKAVLGIDHFTITPRSNAEISCCLSHKTVKMAFFKPFPYTKRLHQAFIK